MEVINKLMPGEEQMAGFFEPDDGSVIYMVNLLKYKEKAEYPDGRETDLTGKEAYLLYSAAVKKCLEEVGGKVEFYGLVRRLTLGDVEELWDDVAIVMYPNRSSMLQMAQLPEMAEIGQHRAAGLAGQLNIETIAAPEFDISGGGDTPVTER